MKKFTKMFCALLMATLLVMTGFGQKVNAASSTDKATVTVSNVEEGAKVTLYKVVKANYNTANDKFVGYELIDDHLIDPLSVVTLTNQADPTDTMDIVAEELGKLTPPSDAKILATYEKDGKTWVVPTDKVGLVIYDMRKPTMEAIESAYNVIDKSAPIGPLTANASQYVQFKDLEPGQYIGFIEPPATSTHEYSPIVVSVGYQGLDQYEQPTSGGTHYKKVDGSFTTEAPTEETAHLYEDAAWDDTNKVANAPTWAKVATTDITQTLIAQNLDLGPINGANSDNTEYDWYYAVGADVKAKRIGQPDLEKDVLNPSQDAELSVVAVDENGQTVFTGTDNKINYLRAEYEPADYMKVLNADPADFFNIDKTTTPYTVSNPQASGDYTRAAALAEMRTTNEDEAKKVTQTVLAASVGEEINYRLTPTLPSYPADATNKTLVIVDNMADSLDFKKGSIEIEVGTTEIIKVYDENATPQYKFYIDSGETYNLTGAFDKTDRQGSEYYFKDGTTWKVVDSQATTPVLPSVGTKLYRLLANGFEYNKSTLAAGEERDFQLNFVYDSLPGPAANKEAPIITYVGTLNDKAIEQGYAGNVNTAKMFYANDPSDDNEHDINDGDLPDDTKVIERQTSFIVYTYQVRVRKTNDKDEYIVADGHTATTEEPHYVMLTPVAGASDAEKAALEKFLSTTAGVKKMYLQNDGVGSYFVEVGNKQTVLDALPTELAGKLEASTQEYRVNPEFKVLGDAKFAIYANADDAHAGNTNYHAVTTTDNNGIATFAGLGQNGDLNEWYLRELEAPEGYVVWTDAIRVKATWETAATYVTTTKYTNTYTVKESEAIDPAQKGWIIADGPGSTSGRFVEMDYFTGYTQNTGDVVNEVQSYTMVKDGLNVQNVFKAYLKNVTNDGGTTVLQSTTTNPYAALIVDVPRVNNTNISELPSTGGIGTYMFTIAGVTILSLAAFMLVFRRKEQHQ